VLILCEKPSAAAAFAKTLGCVFVRGKGHYRGGNYVITYCVGHLYRLWEPGEYRGEWKKWSLENLPILPDVYRYKKNDGTAGQADIVRGLIKSHIKDEILAATDAGREGELIARIALKEAGQEDISRCKRFWVSEALTPDVIRRGIAEAKPLSAYNAVAAQGFARQHADWLVGMNLSRYITLTGGNGEKFSVGRVQSAILAAIVKRNEAAANFIPAAYNELEITATDTKGTGIKAVLVNPETKKTAFVLKSPYLYQAMAYAKAHSELEITIEAVKKAEKSEKLLNITALQKAAFKLYGYRADETLAIAQILYEKHTCLSYPRTPSRVMGDTDVDLFREKFHLLKNKYNRWSRYSDPGLINRSNKHIFNSAALEDHHALIPLALLPDGANDKERNIFEIVVKHFFNVCMADHIWTENNYCIKNGQYIYRATTREAVKAGWKAVFEKEQEGVQETEGRLDVESCRVKGAAVLEKKTAPPKLYQIDTLLAFMERPKAFGTDGEGKLTGLGTAATRAEIIKSLFDRAYITEEKKRLIPTKKGEWLVAILQGDKNLAKLADAAETTAWEKRLEDDPKAFEDSIVTYVKESIKPGKITGSYEKEAVGACPLCGGKVYEGKNNYFCSSWNRERNPCKFMIWKTAAGAEISAGDVKLLLVKKKTGIKGCKSKAGKKFRAYFILSGEGKIEFIFQKRRGFKWEKT
jgi:DNA topoisomerase-3